jgi:hypothetical protein
MTPAAFPAVRLRNSIRDAIKREYRSISRNTIHAQAYGVDISMVFRDTGTAPVPSPLYANAADVSLHTLPV